MKDEPSPWERARKTAEGSPERAAPLAGRQVPSKVMENKKTRASISYPSALSCLLMRAFIASAGDFAPCRRACTSSMIGVSTPRRRAEAWALEAVGTPSATMAIEDVIAASASPLPSREPT